MQTVFHAHHPARAPEYLVDLQCGSGRLYICGRKDLILMAASQSEFFPGGTCRPLYEFQNGFCFEPVLKARFITALRAILPHYCFEFGETLVISELP